MRNPLKRHRARASSPPDGARPLMLVTGNVAVAGQPYAAVADPSPVARDPAPLPQRRVRYAELRARQEPGRADAAAHEASARVARLEHELADARRERERLQSELARIEGKRREADQLAHSERAIRIELERDHASRIRRHEADAGSVLELLEAVQIRGRVLAQDVAALSRLSDEAAQRAIVLDEAGEAGSSGSPAAPVAGERAGPVPSVRGPVLAAELALARSSAPAAAPAVAPDRLAAALARLRDGAHQPALEDAAQGAATPAPLPARAAPWLPCALKRLLRENPALAGTVLNALQPGRRVEGDPAALVRLLLYGRLRRRVCRRFAGVGGDHRALDAMADRIREPLSLGELGRDGARLDPGVTLALVASMIDPSWTAGRRFTVGHQARGAPGRAYLLVRAGAPAGVSSCPPLGPVASTIVCPDEQLPAFLAGGPAPGATVFGDAEPVALVRAWVARAEGGGATL